MAVSTTTIKRIAALRARYYSASLGKESLLRVLSEAEVSEQVYNSNAIENNTMTLEETEKILLEIELDRFLSERELFEAKNLARVVEYITKTAPERELDVNLVMLLHKMLIANIRDDIAGRFRNADEWVRVGAHVAPGPLEVPELVLAMFAQYQGSSENIVKKIARQHLEFERIHPFVDGNGRIGRALNNYLLIRGGYVPINIKFIDRAQYYSAFQRYVKDGATDVMEDIVALALSSSYHKRLAYIEGKKIVSLNDYAAAVGLSHSNVINKAKRQTIEAFFEKNTWKIGLDAPKSET
jgi:Fic family protein